MTLERAEFWRLAIRGELDRASLYRFAAAHLPPADDEDDFPRHPVFVRVRRAHRRLREHVARRRAS